MRIRLATTAFVLVLGLLATACGGTEEASNLSPDAQAGKDFAASSCGGCHTTTGSTSSGPTWKGLAGSQVQLADGSTVTADDDYLTRSILDPGAEITKGFNDSMSMSFPKGSISDEQARQLVAYLNTLK